MLLAALLPFFGLGVDAFIDGIELTVLPFIFGGIILTHLAPKTTVNLVRAERQARA